MPPRDSSSSSFATMLNVNCNKSHHVHAGDSPPPPPSYPAIECSQSVHLTVSCCPSTSANNAALASEVPTGGDSAVDDPPRQEEEAVPMAALPSGVSTVADQVEDYDEDKYPCLRRALSCTDTPILPLGMYAVEFGFDVSSFPFVLMTASANSTSLPAASNTGTARRWCHQMSPLAAHRGDASRNSRKPPVPEDSSSSSQTHLHETRATPSSHDSTSVVSRNCRSKGPQEPITRCKQCHRLLTVSPFPAAVISTAKVCDMSMDDTFMGCRCLSHVQVGRERKGRTTQQSTKTATLKRKHGLSTVDEEDGATSNPGAGDSGHEDSTATNEEENSTCSGTSFGRGRLARKWKKDARTWLWKSSGRRHATDTRKCRDADEAVAKCWKKDERMWLWKSSKRTEN